MKRFAMLTLAACLILPALVQADTSDVDRQILGPWQLKMTTPDGESRSPIVIVGRQFSKYVAWYIGDQGPEAFQKVELKGETLVGSLNPQEHPGMEVTLESRMTAENQCAGTAKFRSKNGGDAGSFNFKGERMSLLSFNDSSTWKLQFTAPDNEKHDATITVVMHGGKHYAWYSGRDHELPARSISIDGDKVVATLAAETEEGAKVEVTFRGTVSGDQVRGTADYNVEGQTGSFPFEGKRAS